MRFRRVEAGGGRLVSNALLRFEIQCPRGRLVRTLSGAGGIWPGTGRRGQKILYSDVQASCCDSATVFVIDRQRLDAAEVVSAKDCAG